QQRVEPQAQALHDAGPEVLDNHLRALHQTAEHRLALRVLQVDGDRTLACVLRQERCAHAPPVELGIGAQLAGQVARAARLDLDDFRPQVGELVAGERAGQHIGQVQDAHTLQGSICHSLCQSTLMPRCFTTSAQRAISASTSAVASAGVLPMDSSPIWPTRSCVAGRRSVAVMASFSFWMASWGVPAGAAKPIQNLMSIRGRPTSGALGTSGSAALRLSPAIISARSLPDWM